VIGKRLWPGVLLVGAVAMGTPARGQEQALFGYDPYYGEYEYYEPAPDPALERREAVRRNFLRYSDRMRALSVPVPAYPYPDASYGRARQTEQRWLYDNGLRSDRDVYDEGAYYERDVSGYFGRGYTYPGYNAGYGGYGAGYGGYGGGYGGFGGGYGGYGAGYGGYSVQRPGVYYDDYDYFYGFYR
jgi:hypothetical protein